MNFYLDNKAVCETSEIGEGTRIWGFTHVLKGAKIGKYCKLGEQVFVENEVIIGNFCTIKNGVALWNGVHLQDHVFIGPAAVFTNDFRPRAFRNLSSENFRETLVRRGATVGAGSVIVCGVTLGEFCMVGAGSVVTKDVSAHSLVVGNPAREIGKVCFCGEGLTTENFCSFCNLPLEKHSLESLLKSAPRR